MADIEFISKAKKARTMKSGQAPLSSSGPEKAIMELLTASQWWSTTLETYWRTAATSKFLGPKLDQAMAALETDECNGREWLVQMPATLTSFKEGLRPGAFDDYESKCLNKVKSHVDVLSCCKSIKEARATGYFDFVEPLKDAVKIFSKTSEGLKLNLEGKLQQWISSMAGDYAVNNFLDLLDASKGSSEPVDWSKFASSLKTLSGSLPSNSEEICQKTTAALPAMFANFHEQALQSITFFLGGGPVACDFPNYLFPVTKSLSLDSKYVSPPSH